MIKKGVSPLIASVFLVAFAIVLGAIVFLSTADLTSKQFEFYEEVRSQGLSPLKLEVSDASLSPNVNCEGLVSKIKCRGDRFYCILLENQESESLNYVVKTTGTKGSEICHPSNFKLEGYQSKIFVVGYNEGVVGELPLNVEVEAVILKN